jgi:hypothetical protein
MDYEQLVSQNLAGSHLLVADRSMLFGHEQDVSQHLTGPSYLLLTKHTLGCEQYVSQHLAYLSYLLLIEACSGF